MDLALHMFYGIVLCVPMMLSEESQLTFISAISKASQSPAFCTSAMLPPHGRDQRSLHRVLTNVCSKRLISYMKGIFQAQRYRCIHPQVHVLSSAARRPSRQCEHFPCVYELPGKAIFEQVKLFLVYAHIVLTFSQMIAE